MQLHRNRRSTVKNLVQNCGADINALDRDGASPLLIAAEKAELDTIKMLLELGADLNLQVMFNAVHGCNLPSNLFIYFVY